MSGVGHTNGPGPPTVTSSMRPPVSASASSLPLPLGSQATQLQFDQVMMQSGRQQLGLGGMNVPLPATTTVAGGDGTVLIPASTPPASVTVTVGMKHPLSTSPNSAEEPAVKKQKLEMPPLQTASGAPVTDVPANSVTMSDSNLEIPSGGKQRSAEPLLSPSPSSPIVGTSTTDAYGGSAWNSAAPLNPDTVEQAIQTAKSHIAKLQAWQQSEQEELKFLQSILAPDSRVSYLNFDKPYTTSFDVVDQATPIPSYLTQPPPSSASTTGSRLSRAAGAQQAQSSLSAVGGVVAAGPTLEELEAQRDLLASKIKLFQADSGRKLDKSLEPPRNKTHWDYVLAEMEWMAADFQRERKWKNNLAKKITKSIAAHQKKELGKEFKALKDEVMARRKRAAWVSREIKKFWSNIGKLVKHKHQTIVEEEKKKQMDRHLEILVDQTETFSSKLAADLTGKGVGAKAAAATAVSSTPAPSASPSSTQTPLSPSAATPASSATPAAVDEDSLSTDGIEVGKVDDILQSLKGPNNVDPRRSSRAHKPSSTSTSTASGPTSSPAAAATSAAAVDDTNDADFGEDESEEDEEGTLSEEEEKEEAEGGASKRSETVKAEVSALEAEAEMSIEDLRKMYGLDQDHDDEEEEEEEEGEGGEDEDEEMATEDAASESGHAASSTPATSIAASPSLTSDQDGDVDMDENDEGGDGDDSDDGGDGGDAGGEEEQKTNTTMMLEKAGAVTEEQRMTVASNLAATAQPTGYTFKEQKVKTKVPFLIKGPAPLREYQHIGLDWLVSMYENGLNGILADEMGLGKTVMTIALLAYLAVEKGIWGQHLIVVPTSVIVNWEMEFKRWLPGFKILCYHGSAKERKYKRRGWSDNNAFHVCITSYQLVLQDARVFKRKKWHYLILDEAHNIKNFKSQRWQTLLNFRTHRRLLLTGTPLQNSVMELWALMHFLMPNIFQSQAEFKNWFSNPVSAMVEGKDSMDSKLLNRLHGILRPFLLRRLKTNVAQQLPQKYEHVLYCKMSKRQRYLYEDFMAASDTQKTLASGNFMSMMNVVMSLRKVVNHPDLFSGRAIVSPFDQFDPITLHVPSRLAHICQTNEDERVLIGDLDLESKRLLLIAHQMKTISEWESKSVHQLATPQQIIEQVRKEDMGVDPFEDERFPINPIALPYINSLRQQRLQWRQSRRVHLATLNAIRTSETSHALYQPSLLNFTRIESTSAKLARLFSEALRLPDKLVLPGLITSYELRADQEQERIQRVCCIIPKARAKPPVLYVNRPDRQRAELHELNRQLLLRELSPATTIYRTAFARQQIFFPDKYLLQWDCGKLQRLALLLRERQAGGHRVLIFTQFSKMLDILESFLSMHGYKYLRLDGSTKVDERQRLMERFNRDTKWFVFILSTRSGGIGINLTGADTCVMYDSDWNPAIDQQAQDRAHRIGQLREVHIFRLITERSIEENILKKSNQKREMNNVVIGDGNFSTDFLEKLDPRELLGLPAQPKLTDEKKSSVTIEEMKEGEPVSAAASPPPTQADIEAEIERQRAEMASLEDEADRVALQQTLAETQQDVDDFTAGELGDKAKERAASAVPKNRAGLPIAAGAASVTGGAAPSTSIRSMGKMGAIRGKPSNSTIPVVAAFENALTPVQRYALYFSEFIDPLISAQQMRATQKQIQTEEAKWKAKQAAGTSLAAGSASLTTPASASASSAIPPSPSPTSAFPTGDAMDISTDHDIKPTVKFEDGPPPGSDSLTSSSAHFPTVKKEPTATSGISLTASPDSNSTESKNVLAGSRPPTLTSQSTHPPHSHQSQLTTQIPSLEDQYLLDTFFHDHPSFYQLLQSTANIPDDLPIAYDYPFQQPEYSWQLHQSSKLQQEQQQLKEQKEATTAATATDGSASSGAPAPVVPLPPVTAIPFGSIPTSAFVAHPYFSSTSRRHWQSRAYRHALRQLLPSGRFRELGLPLREPPTAPLADELVEDEDVRPHETVDEHEYGLFSSPDSLARMLGPRLHHPERIKQTMKQRQDTIKPSTNLRRRIVGAEGDIRISYVSSDSSDPVSIRIPWLRLKSGGIDRSILVLSQRADYPAKTNIHRINLTQSQRQIQQQQQLAQQSAQQEEILKQAKLRMAYEGLKVDLNQPTPSHIQMRPLATTTLVMPPPKKPLALANNNPNPDAASSLSDSSPIHQAIPSSTGDPQTRQSRQRREGLFAVRPNASANLRPRAMAVDETLPRDRFLNWSQDEDAILLAGFAEYGTNWPLIAQMLQTTPRLSGRLRSAKEVCNRYAWIQHKKSGGADMPAQVIKPPMNQPGNANTGLAPPPASGQPSQPPAGGSTATDMDIDDGKKKRGAALKDAKALKEKEKLKGPGAAAAPVPPATGPAGSAVVPGGPNAQQKKPSKLGLPGVAAGQTIGFGSKQLLIYIDRAHKQMKVEQHQARSHLRATFHLPPTEEPSNKNINLPLHSSHREVILQAHSSLGLPPQAIGKTLMPHQILQLRIRNRGHRSSGDPGRGSGMSSNQQRGPPQGGGSMPMNNMPPGSNPSSSNRSGPPTMPPNNMNPAMGPGGPNMAPPSNQRMSSTPNMNQGGGGGGGSNMNRGPGGPSGPGSNQPYNPNQPRSSGSNAPYPNNQGGGGGGGSGNFNPNQGGGNYSSSGQNSSSNYQQGGSSGGGSGYTQPAGSSNAPPIQRYQTAPPGSNAGGPGPSGGGSRSGGANTGGQYNSNSNYSSSNSRGGGGGGGSNYYPNQSGGGGGNYNGPSVSPPPGPHTSSQQGAGSSRSKSPNMNYSGPSGNSSGVMMNASGAPTPNIPPANTNYNYNSGSSGGSSSAHYPSSANRGSASGGNYSSASGGGGGGGNYNKQSTPTSSPPMSDDESNLAQLISWVKLNSPLCTKSALEVFNRTNMTAKQKFDMITNNLSKGAM